MKNGQTREGSGFGNVDAHGFGSVATTAGSTNGGGAAILRSELLGATTPADGLGIYQQLLVLTAPGESEVLYPLLPEGLTLLEVVSAGAGVLHLRHRDGSETKAPCLPPLCLGLVATSPNGLEWLTEAVKSFPDLGASSPFTPRLVDPANGPLGLLLATEIVHRLRAQAEQTTRLAREQARLRATYEHVQNAFAELENFVAWSELQPLRLAFENLPDAVHTTGGSEVACVRQVLPVNVLGLSALELHLGPDAAPRGFVATLATLEDEFEHARWEFGPADAKPGWILLPLPRAIMGLQRTPQLALQSLADARGLPAFSLGAPQPLAAFRALTGSRLPEPTASLALRAWKGLPGVRPPISSYEVLPPTVIGPRVREVQIPFSLLDGVKRVLGDLKSAFAAVEPRPAIRGFLCHPAPRGEITLCTLDGLNHSEPSLLSAQATVLDAKAAPVEFAIAFSSRPERQVETLMARGSADVGGVDFAFTGWRRVVHGRPALLSLILPGPEGRVFFATRMADRAHEGFAGATFGDLRQVFLGTTEKPTVSLPAETPPTLASKSEECFTSSEMAQDAGGALPLDRLEGLVAVDENSSRLSQVPAMGSDLPNLGIACPPPSSGIALRRLPAIEIGPSSTFDVKPRVANADAPTVEFGIAISDLSASEVLLRVSSERRGSDDAHFVFSGWRRVRPGDEPSLIVGTSALSIDEAHVDLMTRLTGKDDRPAKALAFFCDLSFGGSDSLSARLAAGPR